MSFCQNCGVTLSEDAVYCMNCGVAVTSSRQAVLLSRPQTVFSGWITRFGAWLIDVVVVTLALIPMKAILGLLNVQIPGLGWVPFLNLGMDNVFFFLYWTFMEGIYGQSLGKMLAGIRVTTGTGKPIDIRAATIESFGKAFLLPLDCLLGWIFYPTKKQRLFNYLSDTTVGR